MMMKKFFDLFRKNNNEAKKPDAGMQKLMQMVSMTAEQELTCDEVFALVDQFAELVQQGQDASGLMPMVQKHLDLCPDCREEYESLLAMMKAADK